MKLKLENDQVVLKDGMPVYVHSDGKEIAFDAPAAMNKISELNAESADNRRAAKSAKEALKQFEGIEDAGAALKALQTMQNLDEKKLVDAGEVDQLKKSLGEAFTREKDSLNEKLSGKDALIRRLTVSTKFGQSQFIRDKTLLPPDIAERSFGGNFEVEEVDGAVRVVGKLNGNPIFSREKPGEYAGFEECISTIIDARQDKTSILKGSNTSGSGAHGGNGSGGNPEENPYKTGDRTAQSRLILSGPEGRARAAKLANEAGVKVPGLTDT